MSLGAGAADAERELREGMSDTSEGLCVSVDIAGGLVTVNLGGGQPVMPMVGAAPWPGDRVRVGYLGRKPVCLGTVPRSPLGTVQTAASAGKLSVLGDDGKAYLYPYNAALTFTAGDRVVLDHVSRTVMLKISSAADNPVVEAPAAPKPSTSSATFWPTDSGNYRNGAYQNSGVEISDSRSAFYWYGAQIAGSIPDSAKILSATLTLRQEWDEVPGTASQLGTHASKTRTSAPALSGALSVPGGSRTIDIMSFAGALARGEAFGVGFYAGYGWRRYSPASSSGQIYMKWQL